MPCACPVAVGGGVLRDFAHPPPPKHTLTHRPTRARQRMKGLGASLAYHSGHGPSRKA